jgi:hypothetical protein
VRDVSEPERSVEVSQAETVLSQIARLRVIVGYLGEKDQHNWWGCSFFAPISGAFLDPVFPRTAFLARCHGVKAAATRLHDERIGVGRAFHLFRLPEHTEQKLHKHFLDEVVEKELMELVQGEGALTLLEEMGEDTGSGSEGPVHSGESEDLQNVEGWKTVATTYSKAFKEGYQAFPYFTESR